MREVEELGQLYLIEVSGLGEARGLAPAKAPKEAQNAAAARAP